MGGDLNLPEQKVATFIVGMHTYVDEHGRMIDEKCPVVGEPPKDFVRFTARASLTMQFEFGSAVKKFEVPLPRATTVKQAFAQIIEEYPAAMEKAAEEGKKEVMEKVAEKTRQAAIAAAPAGILDAQGKLHGTDGPSARVLKMPRARRHR